MKKIMLIIKVYLFTCTFLSIGLSYAQQSSKGDGTFLEGFFKKLFVIAIIYSIYRLMKYKNSEQRRVKKKEVLEHKVKNRIEKYKDNPQKLFKEGIKNETIGNHKLALSIYEEIVKLHPYTPTAEDAKSCINALNKKLHAEDAMKL